MAKRRLVEVVWLDSALNSGWKSSGSDVSYSECRTVGYKVPASKGTFAVAMSISDSGSFSETMCIPKVCVQSVRRVK